MTKEVTAFIAAGASGMTEYVRSDQTATGISACIAHASFATLVTAETP